MKYILFVLLAVLIVVGSVCATNTPPPAVTAISGTGFQPGDGSPTPPAYLDIIAMTTGDFAPRMIAGDGSPLLPAYLDIIAMTTETSASHDCRRWLTYSHLLTWTSLR